MKLSKNFRKTFKFYVAFPKMLDVGEHELPEEDIINGKDAMTCFWHLENGLESPKTREYNILKRALEGKKSVNLQIKLWAEDIGILLMPSELQIFCKDMPSWIYKATIKQAQKLHLKNIGFVPSFLKGESNNL